MDLKELGLSFEYVKLWLAPIIIVMLILGGLLILAQGSVAPFIYTLFRCDACIYLRYFCLYHDSAACLLKDGSHCSSTRRTLHS